MQLDRIFDGALGLSIIGWGVAALVHAESVGSVRFTIVLLNFAVGALLIVRHSEERPASSKQIIMALPAVAISGVALVLAPVPESWPRVPSVILELGCSFTLLSFAFLGRSFAVLPSFRAVVASGPYALIRHPAYAGELTMLTGAALAAGVKIAAALIPLALFLTVLRIRAEETVLSESEAYREYAARVRHRLFPLIW